MEKNEDCLTMTVGEAAIILGIGRNFAYELARTGCLPGVFKLGTRYLVARTVLVEYINAAGAGVSV